MKTNVLLIALLCCFKLVHAQKYDTLKFSASSFQKGQIYSLPFTIFNPNKLARLYNSTNDSTLNELALFLNENDSLEISIECYSDNRGSEVMNELGSTRKADIIGRYLVEIGNVNPVRILKIGYGETRPIVLSDTIEKYRETDREKYRLLHLQNLRHHIRISRIIPKNTFKEIIDLADPDSLFTSHRSDGSTVFSQYISSACNSDGVVFHLVYQGLNRKLSTSWKSGFMDLESYKFLQLTDNEGHRIAIYKCPRNLNAEKLSELTIISSIEAEQQPPPYNEPYWIINLNGDNLHTMTSISRITREVEKN